jgi:hypothetical protein
MSQEIREYYDYPVAREAGVQGAGLIWYLTRDHLSPPYTNKDEIALNASEWRRGASERCLNLFQALEIQSHNLVLAAQQLRSDILYMGRLYRNGEAVYRQIVAEKT